MMAAGGQLRERDRQIADAILDRRDRAREVAADVGGDQKTGFST
jgi:hypothetical protein